jgi:hypothetical protein
MQPLNVPPAYPISAVFANTAPSATAPWVLPGSYTVKLTVNGNNYTQPLTVRMDPRVKTPLPALQLQHTMSLSAYKGRQRSMEAYGRIHALREQIAGLIPHAQGTLATDLQQLDTRAAALEGASRRGRGNRDNATGEASPGFGDLQGSFATLFTVLEEADLPPTSQATTELQTTEQAERQAQTAWTRLRNDLPALNSRLQAAGLTPLSIH